MDAGVAAIIGAFIGAVTGAGGTLGATLLAGRQQSRTMYAQWSRDGRRDAYSKFISAASAFLSAANDWEIACEDEPDEVAIAELLDTVERLLPEVTRTAQLTVVEGPEGLARLAREIEEHAMMFTVSYAPESVRDRAQEVPNRPMTPAERNAYRLSPTVQAHNAIVNITSGLSKFAEGARNILHGPA